MIGAFLLVKRDSYRREELSELKWPELHIGYDEECKCASATCSICGSIMPRTFDEQASPEERIRCFVSEFEMHVSQCHPAFQPLLTPWSAWKKRRALQQIQMLESEKRMEAPNG
jgi:hypothetical protein